MTKFNLRGPGYQERTKRFCNIPLGGIFTISGVIAWVKVSETACIQLLEGAPPENIGSNTTVTEVKEIWIEP